MNLYLMLVSIIMAGIVWKFSNDIPVYIAAILIVIALTPACVAIARSEYKDSELEARIKALEDKEREKENK